MRCVIVHYHELALKGRNRPFFERRLVRNLREALRGLQVQRVEALPGRIRVTLASGKESDFFIDCKQAIADWLERMGLS